MKGIAIAGKAGTGKNALARELAEVLGRRGYTTRSLAFGDAVKADVSLRYGLRKGDPGGREKLINHGMAMREVDRDYWVTRLASVVATMPDFVVPIITDVRFVNEMLWAKQHNYLTVRLDATHLDRLAALHSRGEDTSLATTDHSSETELDEAVYHVRLWNPHGGAIQLSRLAHVVADHFEGRVSSAA